MTTAATWRLAEANAALIGYRCPACGWVCFPEKKRVCKACGTVDVVMAAVPLGRRGRVLSFVIQHRLPESFESPLTIAIVEFEGGARVVGHLTGCDPDEVEIGLEVEAVPRVMFREGRSPVHSHKFVPRKSA